MLHNSGKFQHLDDIFSCKINDLTARQTYSFGTEIFAQSLVFPEVFLRKFRRERLSNKRLFRDKKMPTKVGISRQNAGLKAPNQSLRRGFLIVHSSIMSAQS